MGSRALLTTTNNLKQMAKIYYISGLKSKIGTPRKYVHVAAYKRNFPKIGSVMFNGQPITAQSQPVYDGWGYQFDGYWMCGEWMAWHQALEAAYGRAQANAIWYTAWMQQSFGAGPQDCKWDNTFTNYLTAVGLLDPNEFSMILPTVSNIPGNVANTVSDVASWIKPVAFIALLAGGAYVYKNYLK